jgi:hypothetical protein
MWFEHGALQNPTWREWRQATQSDREATCARVLWSIALELDIASDVKPRLRLLAADMAQRISDGDSNRSPEQLMNAIARIGLARGKAEILEAGK